MARTLLSEDDLFPVREVDLDVPDPDPDVVYWLKPLTTDMIYKIRGKHTTRMRQRLTGQWVEETNRRRFNEEMGFTALVKWEGIVDKEGQPAVCDDAGKKQMPFLIMQLLGDRAGMGRQTRHQRDDDDVVTDETEDAF